MNAPAQISALRTVFAGFDRWLWLTDPVTMTPGKRAALAVTRVVSHTVH